jgi:hypothetical protein
MTRTSLIVRDRITTVGARAYNVILRAFRAAVSQALLKIEVAVLLARSEDRVAPEGGETAMRKNDRSSAERKARGLQLELLPPLHEWVAAAGLAAVMELLERERAALCGVRYRHNRTRSAFRGGHVPSSLVLERTARGDPPAAGAQPRRPGAEAAELDGVECARPADPARHGAEAAGGVDAPLCALVGGVDPLS